jgi:hypothetical protein
MAGGIYPEDPLTTPLSQEPRSLYVPPAKPGMAQSVGVAVADIPSGITGGDGIKVAVDGRNYRVTMDIAPLQVAAGLPNQQWLPVWMEGTPVDAIRRVPVNAIPADAAHDGIVYGRQNGAWVPAIESVTIDWIDITNKPDTFPPTLPIPSSGVTGLDVHQATQDAAIGTLEFDMNAVEAVNTAQDGRLSAIEAKNLAQDADIDAVEAGLGNTWTKAQADARYVDVTGDTMSGDLAIAKPSPTMVLGKIVGTPARFIGANGGVARWTLTVGDGAAEPGSNAGSDFAITRHDDAGTVIDNPVTMLRSTGVWNFTKTPTVNGSPLIGGATISDTPPVAPVPGQFWWESDSGGLFLRYADANSSQWVQVNVNGIPDAASDSKVYGRLNGTWTQVLPITGGSLTGNLTISMANPSILLSKTASGQPAALTGALNNLARWQIDLGSTQAESSGNAGSDFAVHRFNDAGTYVGSPLQINRATGIATFASQVISGSFTCGHNNALGVINNIAGLSYDPSNGMILESGAGALHVNKIGANGASVVFYQGTACGSITVANGNSTAYNTTSDGRLKEDRREVDAGPVIDALQVYDFKWKDNEARGHGVIAQDAVEVFPEAIFHDEENDTWGADYSKFVPLLLQEVKALRARVAELEAR